MIRTFKGIQPIVPDNVYVDETAVVSGDVEIGSQSSIWCGAVLRGDVNNIRVGARTSVQDNSVLHVRKRRPLIIGDDVTIGHMAHLHACTVGNMCLIGSGSIILDDVEIGDGSIIAAGAIVSPGTIVPPRTLMMGVPAKPKREVTDEEYEGIVVSSKDYVGYAKEHLEDKS